jgi:hypothetical protein
MDTLKKVCRKCDSNFLSWLFGCKRFSKVRKICIDSGRLARSSCPKVQLRLVRYNELPSGYCNIKHELPPQLVFATGFEHGTGVNLSPEGKTENESKENNL